MVNLPLLTMDDHGMLEPTDNSSVSIDYDSKDDLKRKISRWDQDETIYLLNLIKENNFVSRYSVIKMSPLLSQMMLKKGYSRTDKQIQIKLTTLRKNFLTFKRQKINSNNTKECPFYKELSEIYGNNADFANGYDSDENDNEDEYMLIKFPNDPIEWTKAEVQKMLNQIKYMKLKNELTLTFFSPVAVKMIAEAMQKSGYDRSTNSVKNALINLRTMYIDYKMGCENNENPKECIFYSCLDMYWGKEFKKCLLKEKKRAKTEDPWSTEETIVLLTCIQDLNVVEEAYNNTEKSADNIRLALEKQGYSRTKQQVIQRLIQLKKGFVSANTACTESLALQKFPFYNMYKKLFDSYYAQEMILLKTKKMTGIPKDSTESSDVKSTTQNHSISWTDEEVRLLLKNVQELTSKSQLNDSLEDEKLQKLIKVLGNSGHHKTADQIKSKLADLKNSYLKCNRDSSSDKDIFNCPFYNELHSIFHTSVSDQRYEFIQNLLAEFSDLSTSTKFFDHSYTNVKFENEGLVAAENRINDKVTVVPNKCIDSWFPVESIIDDGMSPSTSLELNNISAISNKEQEQVIEDAILATLPHNGDGKEENRTIAEDQSFLQNLSDVNLENHIPSIINNVVLHQEVETTIEESDVDSSKISNFDKSSDLSLLPLSFLGEENGPPPCKKPRIVEEERIGKNKILLRRMDSNSANLNISKPTSKFVRLIVAQDRPNKSSLANHITAHIEPLSVNVTPATSTSTVSSELNSPVDRLELVKSATAEKLLKEAVMQRLHNETSVPKQESKTNSTNSSTASSNSNADNNSKDKISHSIQEAVQTMIKHDEIMQQKHHTWMEQQFEIQRKHEEQQKNVMVKELQELRKCIAILIASKTPHANSQHR